jgi:hypothetical protein
MPSRAANEAFQTVLKDWVGPTLSAAGYRGRAANWIRTSDLGDFAMVNIQRSAGSWPTDPDELGFYVNLAVIPLPWWDWRRVDSGETGHPRHHHGVVRERLHTGPPREEWVEMWWVSDPPSALRVGEDVSTRLQHRGLPRLAELLDREKLLDAIGRPSTILAAMRTDRGVSDELEELLSRLPGDPFPADRFRAWAWARAVAGGAILHTEQQNCVMTIRQRSTVMSPTAVWRAASR